MVVRLEEVGELNREEQRAKEILERTRRNSNRITDPVLIEQEIATGHFNACRITECDGRVNDRIGVLQAGLQYAVRGLHARIHISD